MKHHLTLLGFLLINIACVPLSSTSDNAAAKQQATMFVARKIVTMNDAQASATAIAVNDGKIVAIGNEQEVRNRLSNYRIDTDTRFENQVIMPGFIDNHLHPALAGVLLPAEFITPFDWELPGRSIKGVQGAPAYKQRLRSMEASMGDSNELMITWGYHQLFHGELSRSDLDDISSTRPIVVWQRSFHEIIANSAALTFLGISDDLPAHPAIDIERGHFWETGLFAIFPKLAPIILDPERFMRGIEHGLMHAQANGITTVCDQGVPLFNLDREMAQLAEVIQQKTLPLRMLLIGNAKSLALNGLKSGFDVIEDLPNRNNEQLTYLPKQVKLLADGAFYSQLMQLEDGYLDGRHGEWIMTPEELEQAARLYWNAGYQLHIHVNGDKGVNVVLGILEKLNEETPRPDHRSVLHHYGYSAPDHAERIAALEVEVSANPFYLWALGEKYAEVGMGPERAHNITRLGDLERNGVPVSFHSDLPMAPAAPLALAGIAASRISSKGNVLSATEKMTPHGALQGITINAARAIQQEKTIGSLEVGKSADFTILEQDPYTMSPENWRNIPIVGTVFRGEFHNARVQ